MISLGSLSVMIWFRKGNHTSFCCNVFPLSLPWMGPSHHSKTAILPIKERRGGKCSIALLADYFFLFLHPCGLSLCHYNFLGRDHKAAFRPIQGIGFKVDLSCVIFLASDNGKAVLFSKVKGNLFIVHRFFVLFFRHFFGNYGAFSSRLRPCR